MATHGHSGEFDRRAEDWTAYCERLEQYFLANDVADGDKKRAILLSVCGAGTYQLIRNLVATDKPTDKSFAAIVKLVQDHYTPPPSAIVQRFKFHSRSQKDGESIAEFVAELRRLSEHCQFGTSLDDICYGISWYVALETRGSSAPYSQSRTSTSRRLSNLHKQQKWPNRTRRTYRSRMHRCHENMHTP